MKIKNVVILAGVFLFNSCIVKSLNPFYTEDSLSYDKRLEGDWESENGDWEIYSFKDGITSNFKKKVRNVSIFIDNNDIYSENKIKELINQFRDTYVIYFTEYDKNDDSSNSVKFSRLLATPFTIGDNLLLDCLPLNGIENINNEDQSLEGQHNIITHSVCLVEYDNKGDVKLKWLEDDVIKDLMDNNNLNIKHEKIGNYDDFVLTASSEELYRFLEKFITSNIKDKWNEDFVFNLASVKSKE